ncbi:hypothetical protein HID58_088139 [Brassica napus]|uniref:Uncharacterized protein n=1 Tax=Brassica napus TaxID=3708 RepID=A0ABQ7XVD1_BRANA|nr:hypothetical protein HID58_088139 [Brassica napus]
MIMCEGLPSRSQSERERGDRENREEMEFGRVKLPRNYEKALETIDKHLVSELTVSYIDATRVEVLFCFFWLEKITTTPRRDITRESRREEKAVKAARRVGDRAALRHVQGGVRSRT